MYFDDERDDERDPFEAFGEPEATSDEITLGEFEPTATQKMHALEQPQTTTDPVKTGFSWAGFTGGLAALAQGIVEGVPITAPSCVRM